MVLVQLSLALQLWWPKLQQTPYLLLDNLLENLQECLQALTRHRQWVVLPELHLMASLAIPLPVVLQTSEEFVGVIVLEILATSLQASGGQVELRAFQAILQVASPDQSLQLAAYFQSLLLEGLQHHHQWGMQTRTELCC
jgi:hypothetical protein